MKQITNVNYITDTDRTEYLSESERTLSSRNRVGEPHLMSTDDTHLWSTDDKLLSDTGFTVKIVDRRKRSGFLIEHGGLDRSDATELAAIYLALGYKPELIVIDEPLEAAA